MAFLYQQNDSASLALENLDLAPAKDLDATIDRLVDRLRIAVIFGGDKNQDGSVIYKSGNSRSWKSYEQVAQDIATTLGELGFRHVALMADDMRLPESLRRYGAHIAWLNSGGVQGHNPVAHTCGLLEMLGIPYIGQEPLAATTLDNKHLFKSIAQSSGLPTAPFARWDMSRGPFRPEINSRFQIAFGSYQGPFIVKPVSGRASLHVNFVARVADLPDAIAAVHDKTHNLVLIEQYLSGREYCIAVGPPVSARSRTLFRHPRPFTFAALERTFAPGEQIFTSMDTRPITTDRFRVLDPQTDPRSYSELHRIAAEVFLEYKLTALSRIDLRADHDGKLHILEANPKPDLKRSGMGVTSLISAGLARCGMDYQDLILSLIAGRLDYLLMHCPNAMQHILDLLRRPQRLYANASPSSEVYFGMSAFPEAADSYSEKDLVDAATSELLDFAADRNVTALQTVLASHNGVQSAGETGGSDVGPDDRQSGRC